MGIEVKPKAQAMALANEPWVQYQHGFFASGSDDKKTPEMAVKEQSETTKGIDLLIPTSWSPYFCSSDRSVLSCFVIRDKEIESQFKYLEKRKNDISRKMINFYSPVISITGAFQF